MAGAVAALALVLAIGVVVGVILAPGPAERREPVAGAGCWPGAARCEWVNRVRREHGLGGLGQRAHLQVVAQMWAEHMRAERRLYHNPSFYSTLRVGEVGGENVGYGPDWRTVMRAFMESPGHRANMLDRDWTHLGIGAARDGTRVWVVVVFHG